MAGGLGGHRTFTGAGTGRCKYSLRSSTEFLEEIRDPPGTGTIASLDVESLFTNVPVDETINIIMDRIYRDPSTPQLNIPEVSRRALLEICTKKAPFSTHKGQMFRQKDGVPMGSPLGVLFANFYMGTVEERVFSNIKKPRKYVRYIDDIFVQAENEEEVEAVRRMFQQCRSLKYTVEFSNEGQLPFLDVLVSKTDDSLKTLRKIPNATGEDALKATTLKTVFTSVKGSFLCFVDRSP
ncbi:uncharacterized protein LOC135222531 [Macrobrachium nipponense]|uniref:uncharacterized protein LOC135222531 n=1 Tax=Macrobrachium nipponense TaxID=159736 RepID=UPI0030C86364